MNGPSSSGDRTSPTERTSSELSSSVGKGPGTRSSIPWILLSVALASVLLAGARHRPWHSGFQADGAYFVSLARWIPQGILPYRDIFSQHAPLHVWLLGVASSLAGKGGVIAFGFLVMGTLTAACAGLALQGSRWRLGRDSLIAAALVAWGMSTGYTMVGSLLEAGGRPKTTATALLALGLLALCRRRFGLAGALLASACGSWQPAVAPVLGILGGWVLAHVARASLPKARDLGRLLLGGLVPALLVVVVLGIQGALVPFLEQALLFPLRESRAFGRTPGSLAKLRAFLPSAMVLLGILGLCWSVLRWTSLRGIGPPRTDPSPPDPKRTHPPGTASVLSWALWGWFLHYTIILFFSFDGRSDLIPLLPPLAVFTALLLAELLAGRSWLAASRVIVAATIAVGLSYHHRLKEPRLEVQEARAHAYVEASAGGSILIFADPVLQLLTGSPPHHPFLYWEPGTKRFLDRSWPGGFDGFLREQVDRDPAVVVVGERAGGLFEPLTYLLAGRYRIDSDLPRGNELVWVPKDPADH